MPSIVGNQEGCTLDFVAPTGGVVNGKLYLINGFVLIALVTAAEGETFAGCVCTCVARVAKTSAQAWAVGQVVYLDATNHVADSGAGKVRVGVCVEVAANPTATGLVFFDANDRGGAVGLQAVTKGLPAPVSKLATGNVTLTAAELLSGTLTFDPGGAGRTVTLPTAADLVAGVPNAQVGDVVSLRVINGADAAEAITIAEGTGGTWDANFAGAKTITQAAAKDVTVRLTNVTAASEAYVVYLG
jgi:predicted RecA/RadA family phage recombinase